MRVSPAPAGGRLLLSNADVVFRPGSLRPLLEAAGEEGVGAAAPVLFWDAADRIRLPPGYPVRFWTEAGQLLGRRLPGWKRRFAAFARTAAKLWSDGGRAAQLTGAVLASRKDVFDRIGRFDERFPFEFEETEWEDRLRRAGLNLRVVAGSRARHLWARSAGNSEETSRRRARSRAPLPPDPLWERRTRSCSTRWEAARPDGRRYRFPRLRSRDRPGPRSAITPNASLLPFAAVAAGPGLPAAAGSHGSDRSGTALPDHLPRLRRNAAGDPGLDEAGLRPFEIREGSAADAPGIRRLFARVFGKELPAEEWEWKFARNPDGWFGVVAESDGRIVGNYAGWATALTIGGKPRLAYAVGDVATDPDVRAAGGLRGIYRAMVESFYDRAAEQGVAFCFGFPNARALEISNRIAHTRTIFPIREVRVPCGAFPAPPEDVVAGDSVGEGFDALWAAALPNRPDGPVRDRRRVNWRFHARPTRYYRMVSVGLPDAPRVLGGPVGPRDDRRRRRSRQPGGRRIRRAPDAGGLRGGSGASGRRGAALLGVSRKPPRPLPGAPPRGAPGRGVFSGRAGDGGGDRAGVLRALSSCPRRSTTSREPDGTAPGR